MRIINRRIKRSIKTNLSFYISVMLLTMLTTFIVAVSFSAAEMITEDVRVLMDESNVEDAQFQTVIPLEDMQIRDLESEYNVLIEQNSYMDFESGDKTIRIFAPMEKVNKYSLLEGNNIRKDDEILFDRDFAHSGNIEIGDNYVIDGVSYKVVGFAVRPDYIFAKKNQQDIWVDKENFGMVQVSKAAYDDLLLNKTLNETFYYSVIYNDENTVDDFRRSLYNDYHGYSYLSAGSNSRIDSPLGAGAELLLLAAFVGPLLFGIIMILISIVIGQMIDRERKYIGTLLALGYRPVELSLHYGGYAVLPGFLGSVLGILLSVILGKTVGLYFVIDYQVINYNFFIRPVIFVVCLLIPMFLYGAVSFLKAYKLCSNNIVMMLREQGSGKRNVKRRLFADSRMNFKLKLKIRTLFGNMSRTFTVIFTVFLSTFICALGFSLNDSIDKLVDDGSNNANVYNYSYYLNGLKLDEDYGGEKGIVVPFETGDEGNRINLCGVPTGSKFDDLEIISGSKVQDGYYITNVVAKLYDLAPDDEITITHSVSMEETTVKIDGIINDNTQPVLYASYDNAKEILGISDNYFNVVYSDNELDIDSNEISYMGDSENSLDTLIIALSAFYLFIYGMMILGCVISVISIYLIVNLLIKESETNISMFKVLGYRNREINGIFLTVNHILLPIGFALAIPATLAAINELCIAMISMVNVVMTPAINLTSIIICAAIILLSYLFSLLLLRKKIDKIDLTVSLKGNRE